MVRNKFVLFLGLLIVLFSLIGCLSKELPDKEEECLIKDTEQIDLTISSENTSETLSNHIDTMEPSASTETNDTQKMNIESSDTEPSDTQTESKKPVEDTTTLEPTINSTSNKNSEVLEEEASEVQEEEVPLVPELSMKAFDLINAERVKLGLEPAEWDAECERIAVIRAEEIEPFAIPEHDGFFKFQNENRKLCECLAWGYLTAEDVVDAWINSSAHKDILMDAKYVKLAVARIGNKWVAVNSR